MLKPLKAPRDALNAKGLERALRNVMNGVAKAAKADFQTTTRTWTNRPEFEIDASQPDRRIVKTDDPIYKLVNDGTRAHVIRPKRARVLTWIGTAYRAKTAAGVIGSKRGGNNNTIVYTKLVQHPGTAARNFDKAIRAKWAKEMQIRIQAALVAEMTRVRSKGKVEA